VHAVRGPLHTVGNDTCGTILIFVPTPSHAEPDFVYVSQISRYQIDVVDMRPAVTEGSSIRNQEPGTRSATTRRPVRNAKQRGAHSTSLPRQKQQEQGLQADLGLICLIILLCWGSVGRAKTV
jgi:hypothetical protein